MPCTSISWIDCAVSHKTRPRTDIYYGIEGIKINLRSLNEVNKYCSASNIK